MSRFIGYRLDLFRHSPEAGDAKPVARLDLVPHRLGPLAQVLAYDARWPRSHWFYSFAADSPSAALAFAIEQLKEVFSTAHHALSGPFPVDKPDLC